MTAEQIFVLVPGLMCFLAFSWGTLRHFRSVKPVPFGMRLIEAVSLVTMMAFVWSVFASPLSAAWLVAPILSVGSFVLFAWAVRATRNAGLVLAFVEALPSALLLTGPFRYLRHPFYTSYLIFWLATCVATTSSVCLLGTAILLVCYYNAARKEERDISRSRLAAEYASYAYETGMFLPYRKQWLQQALGREV